MDTVKCKCGKMRLGVALYKHLPQLKCLECTERLMGRKLYNWDLRPILANYLPTRVAGYSVHGRILMSTLRWMDLSKLVCVGEIVPYCILKRHFQNYNSRILIRNGEVCHGHDLIVTMQSLGFTKVMYYEHRDLKNELFPQHAREYNAKAKTLVAPTKV